MQRTGLGGEVRHSAAVFDRMKGPGHLYKVIGFDGAGSEQVSSTDEAVDGVSFFEHILGFEVPSLSLSQLDWPASDNTSTQRQHEQQ